jgi:hypothetical protein
MTINEEVEIKIGRHLADTHVYLGGVEIAVTDLKIHVSGDNPIPQINLHIPVYKGKMYIVSDKVEVTFDELLAMITQKKKGKKRNDKATGKENT